MTLTQAIVYAPYLIVTLVLILWLLIKGYDDWDHPDVDPEDLRDTDTLNENSSSKDYRNGL